MTAVSSFNFGPDYIRRLHKTATKESPGKFTKLYIKRLQREKLRRQQGTKSKLYFGPSTRLITFLNYLIHFKFSSCL